jgi:hypothetical protein
MVGYFDRFESRRRKSSRRITLSPHREKRSLNMPRELQTASTLSQRILLAASRSVACWLERLPSNGESPE